MKKIIVTAVIILVAFLANAQTGMPKELTCTEEAFNFSFSLGTKWKLGTPKMGPVEFTRNGSEYIPVWSLKSDDITPGTYLPPSVKGQPYVGIFNYTTPQENSFSLFYHNYFNTVNTYLPPGINLSPLINKTLLSPNFPVNSISYHP